MKIEDLQIFKEFIRTTSNLYRLGWDERNGGNISCMVEEGEIKKCFKNEKILSTMKIMFDAGPLVGKYFLVTGTGKYFKNIEYCPEENMGLIKVIDNHTLGFLWGFKNNGGPTSELPSHFMGHIARLKHNSNQKVVIHCHPTNLIAMTFIHPLDDRLFTRTLWQMSTECLVVFPEGVSVLPWMLCGNDEIGEKTAEKLDDTRMVIWAQHGIFGAGESLDEAFGLIETAEKAAQIFNIINGKPILQTITDENLAILAEKFKVKPREGYLELGDKKCVNM